MRPNFTKTTYEKIIWLLVAGAALSTTGCATIVSGSRQTVQFSSNPSGAAVEVDGQYEGKTPFQADLKRKKPHTVVIKLDGYKDYTLNLERKFNAWYIGNIGFGGVIGLIVDPITGAMYKLTPKQVNASLEKNGDTKNDDIQIKVSLEIDPSWQKVGQMERL